MGCEPHCRDPVHFCIGCRVHLDVSFHCHGCSTRCCASCDELDESWHGYDHEFTAHLDAIPRRERLR